MNISKDIINEIKQQVLHQLGDPQYYYTYYIDDDKGYYLDEIKINEVELEPRLSGGYSIKINGNYAYNTDFMFDKVKALKFINEHNIEFWEEEKARAQKWLDEIDREIVEKKAQKRARIEVAEIELAKLLGENREKDVEPNFTDRVSKRIKEVNWNGKT